MATAGRKPSTKTATSSTVKKTSTATKRAAKITGEDEALKTKENGNVIYDQLAILMEQVEKLKKELEEKNNSQAIVGASQRAEETIEEIPFRKFIRVMSLTNHKLTLSTEGRGRGTLYNFTNFGQTISIIYEDLAKIIHNNSKFTRNGYFVILNNDVVKLHGLEDDYKKVLTKDQLMNAIDSDFAKLSAILEKSSTHMKETIASIMLDKLSAGDNIDLNKINLVGKAIGKDLLTQYNRENSMQ